MRVDRSFAFVDLCGFTSFADEHGDERAVVILAELRTALREISARRGIRVVKWLGDGAMLSSTMTDAVTAAVLEVRARFDATADTLPLRVGLSSGPVIMFEGDDYIGRAVNLASRLCDVARERQILATEEVADGAPRWVHATRADPPDLRGFHASVPVVELDVVEVGPDAIVDPVCGLRLPRSASVTADGLAPVGDEPVLFCSEACAGSWMTVNAG